MKHKSTQKQIDEARCIISETAKKCGVTNYELRLLIGSTTTERKASAEKLKELLIKLSKEKQNEIFC